MSLRIARKKIACYGDTCSSTNIVTCFGIFFGMNSMIKRKEGAIICLNGTIILAPVVQRLDSAIHRINHYPADSVVCFVNTYPLDSDLFGG